MDKFAFQVNVETTDDTGLVLAVYVRIRKGTVATTKEHANGRAFADYDRKGKLLGIEIIAPCEARILDKIAEQPQAKRFIRQVLPPAMLRKAA